MSDTQKTAVIYARVSTARQVEDELPLESQIEQCKKRAGDLSARIDRVFVDEGISGRSDNRPEFQDAIAYCEAVAPDYLITWSTSRFSRNKIDAGMYKLRLARAGTEIIYVSMNIDRNSDSGWMTESVLELFDEFYSRQIAADTTRSMVRNAMQGYFNGGRPPLGFRISAAADNPKRKRLAVNPEEAYIIEEMFKLRASGMGAMSISTRFNEAGWRNRNNSWNKTTILSMLRNEAYIGHAIFGRKNRATGKTNPRDKWIVVKNHERIISDDLWEQVQSMMDSASDYTSGSPNSTHLFTGMLYCAENGDSMQIESAKGRNKRYYYYNCRNFQKGKGGPRRRIRADLLDTWLTEIVLNKIFTAEFLGDVATEINDINGTWVREHNKRRKTAENAIKTASSRNENLYSVLELYGKEAPNLGDLTRRLQKNNREIREWERKLQSIDAETQPEYTISGSDIDELAASLRYIIETTENPKKLRAFFASFISEIYVETDSVRIEYRPESLVATSEQMVPSSRNWLPESSLLGTRSMVFDLPDRFRRGDVRRYGSIG